MKSVLNWSLLLIFSILVSSEKSHSQDTVVPFDLALSAASHEAGIMFEESEYHSHEIYYNLQGHPAVYALVFKRRGTTAPTIRQIQSQHEAQFSEIHGMEAELENIQGMSISGSEKRKRVDELSERIQAAKVEMQMRDTFITVLASATETQVPVISLHKGLPLPLLLMPSLKANLRESAEGMNELGPVVYLGVLDIFYSLQAGAANRSAFRENETTIQNFSRLIRMPTGEIEDASSIEQEINKTLQMDVESDTIRQTVIEKQWNAAKNRHLGIDEKEEREPIPNLDQRDRSIPEEPPRIPTQQMMKTDRQAPSKKSILPVQIKSLEKSRPPKPEKSSSGEVRR